MESVDRLMRQAIADEIFPGGVLLVAFPAAFCWSQKRKRSFSLRHTVMPIFQARRR
jgi:hypothetical protein